MRQRRERKMHIELAQRTFRDGRWGMRMITLLTLKMLQVRANRVCTRISFFISKTVREIRAFSIHDQKTAETSQPQAQPTDG